MELKTNFAYREHFHNSRYFVGLLFWHVIGHVGHCAFKYAVVRLNKLEFQVKVTSCRNHYLAGKLLV